MSRAPGLRGGFWIAIVGAAFQAGCIHNHYYGTTSTIPGCPPVGSTVTTQVGSVCDVPSGQVIVTNPPSKAAAMNVAGPSNRMTSIDVPPAGSKVVISQPAYGPPSVGENSGRFRWRKLDPETLPTMKAEGALDGPILR